MLEDIEFLVVVQSVPNYGTKKRIREPCVPIRSIKFS